MDQTEAVTSQKYPGQERKGMNPFLRWSLIIIATLLALDILGAFIPLQQWDDCTLKIYSGANTDNVCPAIINYIKDRDTPGGVVQELVFDALFGEHDYEDY